MLKALTLIVVLSMNLTQDLPTTLDLNYKGKFYSYGPAFMSITKFHDSEKFLMFSSFGAFSYSRIYIVPSIKKKIQQDITNIKPIEITNDFTWINFPEVIPYEIFQNRSLLIKDGFIPPFHNNGGIYILIISNSDITKVEKTLTLTNPKKGYYYHEAHWHDFNGDGKKDLLTARSNSKEDGGELLWLEQPENWEEGEPWKEHIIYTGGPDISFTVFENERFENELVVFSGEFWAKKATVMYINKNGGEVKERRVIDDSIGFVYTVQVVELNADGKIQLLVNNHEKVDEDTGIWAYEIPEDFDFINGDYKKYKITGNFKNASYHFIPNMSPGFPYVVWPKIDDKGKKMPNIIIAGDGDYTAHIMTPKKKFDYERKPIKYMDGTVGSMCFDDLDDDGYLDLFIPNYDKNYIEFYQFKPKENERNKIVVKEN